MPNGLQFGSMAAEREIVMKHDAQIEAIVTAFSDGLNGVLENARSKTIESFRAELTFLPDGTIEPTVSNERAIRHVDLLFREKMRAAGFDELSNAYAKSFANLLPHFGDVIKRLGDATKTPFPEMKFTSSERDYLSSQALNAEEQIANVVEASSLAARRTALFDVNGMRFPDLVNELQRQIEITREQATMIADTAVNTFYRTLSARQHELIESEIHGIELLYKYVGPDDKHTRPFCHELLKEPRKSFTRAQIGKMNNLQIPDVFITGGGWNCRHQWILDTSQRLTKAKLL